MVDMATIAIMHVDSLHGQNLKVNRKSAVCIKNVNDSSLSDINYEI